MNDNDLAPHHIRRTSQFGDGWIGLCHCGYQTRTWPSEAKVLDDLDDHITYLTSVGLNEVRPR